MLLSSSSLKKWIVIVPPFRPFFRSTFVPSDTRRCSSSEATSAVRRRGIGVGARTTGVALRGVASHLLRVTDGQVALDDAVPGLAPLVAVLDAEQGARVAGRDLVLCQDCLHLRLRATAGASSSRPTMRLRPTRVAIDSCVIVELLGEALEGEGLFQRAEVLALQVFDQRQLQQRLRARFLDDDRHALEPGLREKPAAAARRR